MTKLLNIKSQREKGEITFEISTINFTGDFSTGTMEARRTKITFQSIWIECSYLQEHGFVNNNNKKSCCMEEPKHKKRNTVLLPCRKKCKSGKNSFIMVEVGILFVFIVVV